MKTRYKNIIGSYLENNITCPKNLTYKNTTYSNDYYLTLKKIVMIGYSLDSFRNNIEVLCFFNLDNHYNTARFLKHFTIKDLFYQKIEQKIKAVHINSNVSFFKYL